MNQPPRELSYEYLLTPQGLERGRKLLLDPNGRITAIEPVTTGPWDGALAVPGMANAHSHCFQRALAGVRESVDTGSFWGWRETMYRIANALDPQDLYVIALQAFREMLAGGYTSVGEFHYLHHPRGGKPAAGPSLEMIDAVQRAAHDAGIRLTMLPVLYQHGGFGVPASAGQRRFLYDSLDDFGRLLERLRGTSCGIAPHSLRAVQLETLPRLVSLADEILGPDCPIHIHVSEQHREVDECKAYHGRPPIQCLADTVALSDRWNLVHATHAEPAELELMLARRPTLVMCPLTEAYLGDGVFPLAAYSAAGGQFAIGSDSNARIDAVEELRLAEYGQRLTLQRRGVLAGEHGLGRQLWASAAALGARALRQDVGTLAVGNYADVVTLDLKHPLFAGVPVEHCLDAWLIGGGPAQIAEVRVGGCLRVAHGQEGLSAADAQFTAAMERLYGGV